MSHQTLSITCPNRLSEFGKAVQQIEAEHQIGIRIAFDRAGVVVRVEDDGRAFNPLEAPKPDLGLGIDERPVGGLGVHIVRSLMDALEYRRENGRNIFIMRKRTPGDAAGD